MVCCISFLKIVHNACHKLEIKISIENSWNLDFFFSGNINEFKLFIKKDLVWKTIENENIYFSLKITKMYARYTLYIFDLISFI